MKRIVIAGVSALAIGLGAQAFAQSVSVEIGPAAAHADQGVCGEGEGFAGTS